MPHTTSKHNIYSFLQKKREQCHTLWYLILLYQHIEQVLKVQQLIQAALILEDHIETGLSLYNIPDRNHPPSMTNITQFYSSAPLHHNQVKYSKLSLAQQLSTKPSPNLPLPNWYSILYTSDIDIMTVDQSDTAPTQQASPSTQSTKFWVQDTSLSSIADLINTQLKQDAANQTNTDTTDKHLGEEHVPQQHLRLNLVRHRGATGSFKTIDLFKSFVLARKSADPLLVILLYASSKEHYTPITSTKHVHAVDGNKMLQFFQLYYKKQMYSLSGYLQVKSSLSYKNLIQQPQVEEWLDLHCYSLKLCPSQTEEIVPVGALCFGNLFMHREELK